MSQFLVVGNFDVNLAFSPFLSEKFEYLNIAETYDGSLIDLEYTQVFILFSLNPVLEGSPCDFSVNSANEVEGVLTEFLRQIKYFLKKIGKIKSSKFFLFEPPLCYRNPVFDNEFSFKHRCCLEFYDAVCSYKDILGEEKSVYRVLTNEPTSAFNDFRYFNFGIPFTSLFLKTASEIFLSLSNAAQSPPKKVIVLDCDNTLWGGVVGELGPAGIDIGPQKSSLGSDFTLFQKFLKNLRAKGILLALCSKNNQTDVCDVFSSNSQMILDWEDFSTFSIGWGDKATGIREISESLNLGLSSFVFIDDSEFECGLIRSALPEVEVLMCKNPNQIIDDLNSSAFFSLGSLSQEDIDRANFYKQEKERSTTLSSCESFEEYVSSLNLKLTISVDSHKHKHRISQLVPKTNQFIFNEFRPDFLEIERWLESTSSHIFTGGLSDKYGQYGVIGIIFVQISDNVVVIKNMLMSCRALGRSVELVFLSSVVNYLVSQLGPTTWTAEIQEMSKNAPALAFCRSVTKDDAVMNARGDPGIRIFEVDQEQLSKRSLMEIIWE